MPEFERGQFEGKVIQSLTSIEEKLDVATTRLDDHESRVRKLEYKYWLALGASGAVSFTVTKAVAAFF